MSIVVRNITHPFKVILEHEKEKIEFMFKQLDYKTKAKITSLVTRIEKGQIQTDANLQVFYNIKHALKDVKGLKNEEGKVYKLAFEDKEKTELTDECVDELLSTVLSDNLQFAAHRLTAASYPSEIKHPLTGQKIEGIEVVQAHEMKGIKKK